MLRITALAAGLMVAVAGCSAPPSGTTVLTADDAEAIGLAAYSGDVLILDFWAVW